MEMLLTQPRHPKEQPLSEEIATLLEAELLDQPRPASDIIAVLTKAGFKRRNIESAKALCILNKLMAKPENVGGSWYWRLLT
jgi:hypothetical protein